MARSRRPYLAAAAAALLLAVLLSLGRSRGPEHELRRPEPVARESVPAQGERLRARARRQPRTPERKRTSTGELQRRTPSAAPPLARIWALARSPREADRHQAILALRGIPGPEASRILVWIIVHNSRLRREEQTRWSAAKGGETWALPTLAPLRHPLIKEAVGELIDREDDAALGAAYAGVGQERERVRRYLLGAIANFPGEENRKLFFQVIDATVARRRVEIDRTEAGSIFNDRPLVDAAVGGLVAQPGPGGAERLVTMLKRVRGMDQRLVGTIFLALQGYQNTRTVVLIEGLLSSHPKYARDIGHFLRLFDLPASRQLLSTLARHANPEVAEAARESLEHLNKQAKRRRSR